MKNIIIAIDGPSASGKGTIAKAVSKHFAIPYLNTGALYRYVAFKALEQMIELVAIEEIINLFASKIDSEALENEELFSERVGVAASIIAKDSRLRQALLDFQRNFISKSVAKGGGCVLDGRDIGTVIFPEATHKFFVMADVEIRAKRRFEQLSKTDSNITFQKILDQLIIRDQNDSTRKDAPLLKASDAILIDNSYLSIKEGVDLVINSIIQKI